MLYYFLFIKVDFKKFNIKIEIFDVYASFKSIISSVPSPLQY